MLKLNGWTELNETCGRHESLSANALKSRLLDLSAMTTLAQDGRRCMGTRSVSSAKEIPNVSRTVTPDLSRTKTARSV
jgi:hypothetical protein